MERKGIKMVFKPYELKYFLFKRKLCPICESKLVRRVKKFYVGKEHTVTATLVDMYEYRNFYYCSACDKEFSINELAKMS